MMSPSWFWFFCCLSRSVSVLHRIRKPEHDTLQIPADHWGLTTAVPELYTFMSTPRRTQKRDTRIRGQRQSETDGTHVYWHTHRLNAPRAITPHYFWETASANIYISYSLAARYSVLHDMTGVSTCFFFFLHMAVYYFHLKSISLFEVSGSCILWLLWLKGWEEVHSPSMQMNSFHKQFSSAYVWRQLSSRRLLWGPESKRLGTGSSLTYWERRITS